VAWAFYICPERVELDHRLKRRNHEPADARAADDPVRDVSCALADRELPDRVDVEREVGAEKLAQREARLGEGERAVAAGRQRHAGEDRQRRRVGRGRLAEQPILAGERQVAEAARVEAGREGGVDRRSSARARGEVLVVEQVDLRPDLEAMRQAHREAEPRDRLVVVALDRDLAAVGCEASSRVCQERVRLELVLSGIERLVRLDDQLRAREAGDRVNPIVRAGEGEDHSREDDGASEADRRIGRGPARKRTREPKSRRSSSVHPAPDPRPLPARWHLPIAPSPSFAQRRRAAAAGPPARAAAF
jgi:hypothetical protein